MADTVTVIQLRDDSFLHVSTKPPESMSYEPQQSYMVAFGVDQTTGVSAHSKDAEHIADSLVSCGVLPKSNVQLCTTLSDHDTSTSQGIQHAFKECGRKVGPEGLFVFAYTGSGVQTDSNCSLYSIDFDECDTNTHITPDTLLQWLTELQSKPKHIIFILDCSFAGKIASDLTAFKHFKCNNAPQDLCVLSARSGSEMAFVIDTLGHSIFSYFVAWAFRHTPFTPGLIPTSKIYERIQTCTFALSSLVLTYNPLTKVLKPNVIDPEVKYLKKQSAIIRFVEQALDESPGSDETDAPVARFEYLTKYYKRTRGARHTSLHDKAMAWLEMVRDDPEGPLAKLHANNVLHDNVLLTVFCSIMFSVASIQVAVTKDSISDPNLFIYAFLSVAATINAVNDEADITVDYFRHSWEFYHQVLVENGVRDKKFRELFVNVNKGNKKVSCTDGNN